MIYAYFESILVPGNNKNQKIQNSLTRKNIKKILLAVKAITYLGTY